MADAPCANMRNFCTAYGAVLIVQDYWDSASRAGSAEQPDNPRPVQQSDDRLPANHLGLAVKPNLTVSLASRDWLSLTPICMLSHKCQGSQMHQVIVMLANVDVNVTCLLGSNLLSW